MRVLAVLLVLIVLAGCVKTKDATGTDSGGTTGDQAGGTTTPPPPAAEPVALAVSAPQLPPYTFTPNALKAKAGDTVNLTFTNEDAAVPHNWVLDEAKATTDTIGGGESTSVTFVAPAAGTYTFYCAVGQHRQLGMTGTFTVE